MDLNFILIWLLTGFISHSNFRYFRIIELLLLLEILSYKFSSYCIIFLFVQYKFNIVPISFTV